MTHPFDEDLSSHSDLSNRAEQHIKRSENIELNTSLSLKVTRAALGGLLLSYAPDGRVVWLYGVAGLNDLVRARITRVRKKSVDAKIEEIITPSKDSVQPFCPHVYLCNGCPWQALSIEQQIDSLTRDVKRALNHAMGEEIHFLDSFVHSERQWRHTTRLHWDGTQLGFYGPTGLIDLPDCPIFSPNLSRLFSTTRTRLIPILDGPGEIRLSVAEDAPTGTIDLQLWGARSQDELKRLDELFEAWVGSDQLHGVHLCAHTSSLLRASSTSQRTPTKSTPTKSTPTKSTPTKSTPTKSTPTKSPQKKGAQKKGAQKKGAQKKGAQKRENPPKKKPIERSWGDPFNVLITPTPAGSFMQAHQVGNHALIQEVISGAKGAKRILEFYSGSGNLSVPLLQAEPDRSLLCVEYDEQAVESLHRYAQQYDLNLKAYAQSAHTLPEGDFDHILLDPPRAGAKPLIPALNRGAVKALTYVSCHPAALARDLSTLRAGGWYVEHARLFHLFPHSGHVEVYVKLKRNT